MDDVRAVGGGGGVVVLFRHLGKFSKNFMCEEEVWCGFTSWENLVIFREIYVWNDRQGCHFPLKAKNEKWNGSLKVRDGYEINLAHVSVKLLIPRAYIFELRAKVEPVTVMAAGHVCGRDIAQGGRESNAVAVENDGRDYCYSDWTYWMSFQFPSPPSQVEADNKVVAEEPVVGLSIQFE